MRMLRERALQLKEKRPGYGALLDFYVEVREAQAASRASLRVDPVKIEKGDAGVLTDGGASLVHKEDFPVDVEASISLFRSLCRLGGAANPHLAAQMEKIEQALADNALDLRTLVAGGGSEKEIARAAADRGLDEQVLSFLVRSSTRPSIEAASEVLRGGIDLESSRTGPLPRLRFPARAQSSERGRGNPVLPLFLVRLPMAGRPALLLRLRQQGAGDAALFLRRG